MIPASVRVIGRAVITWWDDWIPLVVVNLLWALLCFTIVLAPPATFGLYAVAHALRRGESRGAAGLLESLRRYFWPSWRWAVVNVVVLALLWVSFIFYSQVTASWGAILTGLTLVLAVLWLTVQFYALPFYMEQEQPSLRQALRNGLFLALAAPGYTAILMAAAALVAVACLAVLVPLFLGGPCLLALLGLCAVHERLIAYGKRAPDIDPDEEPARPK